MLGTVFYVYLELKNLVPYPRRQTNMLWLHT